MKVKGKTVVLITHRPGVLAVADRLLLLQDGRVQAEGPRDAVLAALKAAARPPNTASSDVPPTVAIAAY